LLHFCNSSREIKSNCVYELKILVVFDRKIHEIWSEKQYYFTLMNWSVFWQIFSLVFLFTAIPVAVMIILEKRSPFKTIAWILVLILVPIIGLVFYLFFGQEYRKQKLFSRRGIKSLSKIRKLSVKQLREIDHTHLQLNPVI